MNFISRMEGQAIQVELKYCERCGGLWLRPQGADGVYCASCRMRLAVMPEPGETAPRKARHRKKRAPGTDFQREDFQKPARIEYLQGVATMEART